MPAKLNSSQLRRHDGGKDWHGLCCRRLLFSYRDGVAGSTGSYVAGSSAAYENVTLTLQFIWQHLFFWTFLTKTVARNTCCAHSYISRHLLSSLLINKHSKISHKERHVFLTVCLEYYISQWSRCFACSLREKTNSLCSWGFTEWACLLAR